MNTCENNPVIPINVDQIENPLVQKVLRKKQDSFLKLRFFNFICIFP